jgi:hypothetical protein
MPGARQVHFYELKASPVKSAIETIKKAGVVNGKGNLADVIFAYCDQIQWSQYWPKVVTV